jgi:hypothetical protein
MSCYRGSAPKTSEIDTSLRKEASKQAFISQICKYPKHRIDHSKVHRAWNQYRGEEQVRLIHVRKDLPAVEMSLRRLLWKVRTQV